MSYLTIRGWDRYQHYKDRDPPWIKLYRDILTTESWVLGDDTSRLIQIASILLAARYSNQIPLQWKLIQRVASLDCSEKDFNSAVSHLCNTKFLEIQSVTSDGESVAQSASTVLATCTTETEQKDKEETEQRRGRRGAPATRLPDDFELTPERRAVAEAERLPAERTFAKFCNHWRSESGAKARKHDWDGTWRNWCMRENDHGVSNGTHRRNGQQKPSAVEAIERSTAEWARERGVDPASI